MDPKPLGKVRRSISGEPAVSNLRLGTMVLRHRGSPAPPPCPERRNSSGPRRRPVGSRSSGSNSSLFPTSSKSSSLEARKGSATNAHSGPNSRRMARYEALESIVGGVGGVEECRGISASCAAVSSNARAARCRGLLTVSREERGAILEGRRGAFPPPEKWARREGRLK
jgi:hypothetical protein